jgi:hypothetical protein
MGSTGPRNNAPSQATVRPSRVSHRKYLGSSGGVSDNGAIFVPESVLMSVETVEFVLLLGGWVVAFLLGRELQTGFRQWRLRAAEQRARRQD